MPDTELSNQDVTAILRMKDYIDMDIFGNSTYELEPSSPLILSTNNELPPKVTNDRNTYIGTLDIYRTIIDSLYNDVIEIANDQNLDLVFFSYDWRLFTYDTSLLLRDFITNNRYSDVIFIAHSFGGYLVADYLLNNQTAQEITKQVHILGTPFEGTVVSLSMLTNGHPNHFFGSINIKGFDWIAENIIREMVDDFPSVYQLLPSEKHMSYKRAVGKWYTPNLFNWYIQYLDPATAVNYMKYSAQNIIDYPRFNEYIDSFDDNGDPIIKIKPMWDVYQNMSNYERYYILGKHILVRESYQSEVYFYYGNISNGSEVSVIFNAFNYYDSVKKGQGDGITNTEVISGLFGGEPLLKLKFYSLGHMDLVDLKQYSYDLKLCSSYSGNYALTCDIYANINKELSYIS